MSSPLSYSSKMQSKAPSLKYYLLVLSSLTILILHAYSFYSFLADDALISLQYAKRFLLGKGLSWTDGIPVEGYSNLLWVLLVSAIAKLGFDLVDAARILGIFTMGLTTLALFHLYKTLISKSLFFPVCAVLFFVFAGPIAAWSIGGLEQPLLAALLAWSIILSYPLLEVKHPNKNQFLVPGLAFGLLCLCRPDAPLFLAAACLALLIIHGLEKQTLKNLFFFALIPALFIIGQFVFRLSYYGHPLPNTAYVKLGLSHEHFLLGLRYLFRGFCPIAPLLLLSVIAIFVSYKNKVNSKRTTLLIIMLLFWLPYIAIIGGDVNPPSRHFVPIIVILCLLLSNLFNFIINSDNPKLNTESKIFFGFILFVYIIFQAIDAENIAARNNEHQEYEKALAQELVLRFKEKQPLIAVDQAGWPVFYTDFPALDMLGLNDYEIARKRPANFGTGWIGHELTDASYILIRSPDIFIFCGPRGSSKPCFPSSEQLFKEPRFFELYQIHNFQVAGPPAFSSKLWLRKDSDIAQLLKDSRP